MCGTDVISIYIFIQFMENIPLSLDESAIIDGANYWQIYWKIMLPLLKPAIVTSCILKGVGVYNEYYAANLYLMRKEIRTMALSLYTFVGPMGSKYNLICAGVIISLLPALIVVSALGGFLIAWLSFRPMEKVISTAEAISDGGDLSRRIGLPKGRSEISRLCLLYTSDAADE